jgi:hypothetical protein
MSSFETTAPTHLAGALQQAEMIYVQSHHTLEGTRPDGPGATVLAGLAHAVAALRQAHEAVAASGERGI